MDITSSFMPCEINYLKICIMIFFFLFFMETGGNCFACRDCLADAFDSISLKISDFDIGTIEKEKSEIEKFDPLDIEYETVAPKVWAVIVGIAKYNHVRSLNYTDDDAYQVYAFLKSPEGGALPDKQIRLLIDENATKTRIINAMNAVFKQALHNDVVLFFFSGHGTAEAFIPFDYDILSSSLLYHKEFLGIIENSAAKHKICIADACHAGAVNKDIKSPGTDSIDNYYEALINSKGGMVFMVSSKAEEKSIEDGGKRQGVFSYYLIKGLKGNADPDGNKIITIQELFNYVKTNVKIYTNGQQHPVLYGNFDINMPVGAVR
ncbi:MAG: caspase family protein [Desulfobacteraceae bacterium]|nr:caspase family protein [Desulfobacteraceae bacterium]